MDFNKKIRGNGVLMIADGCGIVFGLQLARKIPTVLGGTLLIVSEAIALLLLADMVWIHYARKQEKKTQKTTY